MQKSKSVIRTARLIRFSPYSVQAAHSDIITRLFAHSYIMRRFCCFLKNLIIGRAGRCIVGKNWMISVSVYRCYNKQLRGGDRIFCRLYAFMF